jgi:hypothetical protein
VHADLAEMRRQMEEVLRRLEKPTVR